MDITTKQSGLSVNSDVSVVIQKIILKNDGLDASMPEDLNLGNFSEYTVMMIKNGEPPSIFKANITSISHAEEDATSGKPNVETTANAEQIIENNCHCDGGWKNHGEYVSCVAVNATELIASGMISQIQKGAIVSNAAKSSCGKK